MIFVHMSVWMSQCRTKAQEILSVSLVRKRIYSLNKEGKLADSQDAGDESNCRSFSNVTGAR